MNMSMTTHLLTYLELIVHEESRGFSMTEKCSSPSLTDGPRTGIVGVEGGGGNPGRRGTPDERHLNNSTMLDKSPDSLGLKIV